MTAPKPAAKADTSASVEGRVVIVTGSGGGIGRAYAKHFAANGAIPVIAEINGQNGQAVAEEIRADGHRALAVQTDVTDEKSVQEMVDRTMAEYGRVDALVNNAAIFAALNRAKFEDIPRDDWTKMLDVNVIGSWICAKSVTPHMRAGGYGRIVNVSSSTVPTGLPFMMHYITSKAAVIGMTRRLGTGLRHVPLPQPRPGLDQLVPRPHARHDPAQRVRRTGRLLPHPRRSKRRGA